MSTALITLAGAGASEDDTAFDAAGGHRPLAVADVQQALRELRAGQFSNHPRAGGDSQLEPRGQRGDRKARTGGDSGLPSGWIAILAGHAGAGASTVALAISDAAATTGRPVHLVDDAPTSRSGLVAAASAELGVDETGAWRRGFRATVTIDRRTGGVTSDGWPTPPGRGAGVTVVDLGLQDVLWDRSTTARMSTVVVCRPTVPGVRLTEHLLCQLVEQPVVIAAVGPSRWAAEVIASAGPRLRAVRLAGRVVPVPLDHRLQVTGLTDRPLPKPVIAAGRQLLQLLDPMPAPTDRPSTAASATAPTRERTHR